MSYRPTRYYVNYVHRWIEDEAPETRTENFAKLADAKAVYEAHSDALPQVFERIDIRDTTPKGDPRGLIWDFDERLVIDCPELLT